MHGRWRLRAAMSALLAVVLLVSLASAVEARRQPRLVGFRTDAVSVAWGGSVRDGVRIEPRGRATLLVQARRLGTTRWSTLSRVSTSATGRASLSLLPPSTGAWQFRVVAKAADGRPRLVSGIRVVRATSPALTTVTWTTGSFTVDRGQRRDLGVRVTTGTSSRPRLVSLVRQGPGEQGWTTIATTTTDAQGRATFGFSSLDEGSVLMRVVAYATAAGGEAWAPARTMRIVPAVVEGAPGDVQVVSGPAVGAWSHVTFSADSSVVAYAAGGSPTTVPQAWMWDRRTDAHRLVSATPDGLPAPWPVFAGTPTGVREVAVSPDGKKVAFVTDSIGIVDGDTQNRAQVYVRDMSSDVVTVVSRDVDGNLVGGQDPVFSPDGGRLAFSSGAPRITADDLDTAYDVFEVALGTGQVRQVSRSVGGAVSDGGSAGPVYSPDGAHIAFRTDDSTLVPADPDNGVGDVVMETDGQLRLISSGPSGYGCGAVSGTTPTFSPDNTRLAYDAILQCPGDPARAAQAVVVDLDSGTGHVVSSRADGTEGDGWSGGRFSWSADGRYLAFSSVAANLTGAGTHGVTVVKDLQTGALTRAARTAAGTLGDGEDSYASFARVGGRLMLVSTSTDLGSTTPQAYVGTVQRGMTIATASSDGVPGDSATAAAWLAPDGRSLLASSYSGSMVGEDDHRLRTYLVQLD